MMNDFTKEELILIKEIIAWHGSTPPNIDDEAIESAANKIQSMIDDYESFGAKKIAQSHLNEASSLIYHAMSLLGLVDEEIDNYCKHELNMDDWVNDSMGCRWYECMKCEGRYRE
jgi:hypothetical protein